MKFDFTSIIDRKGKDALAIDGIGNIPGIAPELPKEGFEVIPMWVADMNFKTAPAITESIIERVQHPIFGYFSPKEEYYKSIIRWQTVINHVENLEPKHIGYENGVLGGVISSLNVLCSKGDKVLLHSPTYIGFTMSLENNGYHIVHSQLVRDSRGKWRMDFEDMEKKLSAGDIHSAIFCSPHNPTGRVWEKEEIERAMALFKKYDVFVISDEIWSDLILGNNRHIPTQSISEDARMRTIGLYAPSKTFNLAGLVGSYHIIYNNLLRNRIIKESSLCHYNEMNVLSMYALIGAYSKEGEQWLGELLQVLDGNVEYACNHLPEGISFSRPEGTYMLFIDCSEWCKTHNRSIDDIEKACWNVGVAVQDGRIFHGECHLRINLALPLSKLREAFTRLNRYVFTD